MTNVFSSISQPKS
jgi:hypothetical protein